VPDITHAIPLKSRSDTHSLVCIGNFRNIVRLTALLDILCALKSRKVIYNTQLFLLRYEFSYSYCTMFSQEYRIVSAYVNVFFSASFLIVCKFILLMDPENGDSTFL
jgi:hypothetical protein